MPFVARARRPPTPPAAPRNPQCANRPPRAPRAAARAPPLSLSSLSLSLSRPIHPTAHSTFAYYMRRPAAPRKRRTECVPAASMDRPDQEAEVPFFEGIIPTAAADSSRPRKATADWQ